jgi:Zinc dependent phospholipase C
MSLQVCLLIRAGCVLMRFVKRASLRIVVAMLAVVLLGAADAHAYSVLTHEELIDLTWDREIVPMLKSKFPNITPEELKEAHAYAYGGAVMQDLGYYPFGSAIFSDFSHYVRTGDLVRNLLRDAKDADEYAFALGSLTHYIADRYGHPMAVNRAVPIEYPKLRIKYGDVVTYAQDKVSHLRTEFGFDVVQVAKRRYAPESYHDFIDFKVAKPLLERAFQETYGLPLNSVLTHEDLAIGSYRRAVSTVIPEMTKVALATRGNQMAAENKDFNRRKFLYNLSRADYERSWGRDYSRPGVGARILSFLFRLVPKVGPFKALKYKDPTPQTEDLYFKSVNTTLEKFETATKNIANNYDELNPYDLDTGQPTEPGEYSLTDESYARWVDRLEEDKFAHLTPEVKYNVLAFYEHAKANLTTRKHHHQWKDLQENMTALRAAPTVGSAISEADEQKWASDRAKQAADDEKQRADHKQEQDAKQKQIDDQKNAAEQKKTAQPQSDVQPR